MPRIISVNNIAQIRWGSPVQKQWQSLDKVAHQATAGRLYSTRQMSSPLLSHIAHTVTPLPFHNKISRAISVFSGFIPTIHKAYNYNNLIYKVISIERTC